MANLVLIQLIAASAVGRNLHYFAFGEKKMVENIEFLLLKLKEHNVTFGKLVICSNHVFY
jgi:hypothetical protein